MFSKLLTRAYVVTPGHPAEFRALSRLVEIVQALLQSYKLPHEYVKGLQKSLNIKTLFAFVADC